MKRVNIAALGITLAVSSTALFAASFDASSGTYDANAQPPRVELQPSPPQATVAEESRTAAPIISERREVQAAEPREYWVELQPQPQLHAQRQPHYDPRHPQMGQLIERGLFNRTGPNDFGA